MIRKLNLVFMGGFTYPRGMAGTKRIQHAINALKEHPGSVIRVIVQLLTHGLMQHGTWRDEASRSKRDSPADIL